VSITRVFKLRIAILGLGSIGGLFLSALVDSYADLVVGTRGIKLKQILEEGIAIHSPEGAIENIPSNYFELIDTENTSIPKELMHSCDIVLICGKSNSIPVLSELASKLLSDNGFVMGIQNGISHLDYLSDKFSQKKVLLSTVTHGVWHNKNVFYWEGRGIIKIGKLDDSKPSDLVLNFIKLLNESNLSPVWSNDIRKELWIKLLINIGINPICAITGLKNGAIKSTPNMWEQAISCMGEASHIAFASGIDMSGIDIENLLMDVVLSTANNRCSMLQDIMANRLTEIDSLCGEIITRGESLGIPTPLNLMLLTLIKGIENSSIIE
jgi:2-dehydropantoate 2-reductase